MFTVANSEIYWSGNDVKEFNQHREKLEQHQIPYKHKVSNRMGQWGGARGTLRGNTGSAGIPAEDMYEIIIYKKDMDRTLHLKNMKAVKEEQKIVGIQI